MNIQIVSGFLGSGKTTFLNRYMTCLQGRVAVIENEFGPAVAWQWIFSRGLQR